MRGDFPSIVWFRQDLRLADNPALAAALESGAPIVPLYILADEDEGEWRMGGAQRWWLHQSLGALAGELAKRGSRLVLRRGSAEQVLEALRAETGATAVYWNRRYEPLIVARDQRIKEHLRAADCVAESFNSALLLEPWQVRTKAGGPFQVFTPYWRQCLTQVEPDPPLPASGRLPVPTSWPASLQLDELQLLPRIHWYHGIADSWQPGESGAHGNLEQFLESAVRDYTVQRNVPAQRGTSRLSPHLHFGELSPRQVWHATRDALEQGALIAPEWKTSQFLTELGWREFAHHLLFHYPHTVSEPLRAQFKDFPWVQDKRLLRAWQRGETGIPLVDAGMRELWSTGWMHNRVRMVVASFLVKNLRIHWLEGARWFWDTLVDADLASNTLGWQWVAGCGADAAPYFRIFNPISQAEKFDPSGEYVAKWAPEYSQNGGGAPHNRIRTPIVSLGATRAEALSAYRSMGVASVERSAQKR